MTKAQCKACGMSDFQLLPDGFYECKGCGTKYIFSENEIHALDEAEKMYRTRKDQEDEAQSPKETKYDFESFEKQLCDAEGLRGLSKTELNRYLLNVAHEFDDHQHEWTVQQKNRTKCAIGITYHEIVRRAELYAVIYFVIGFVWFVTMCLAMGKIPVFSLIAGAVCAICIFFGVRIVGSIRKIKKSPGSFYYYR